MNTINNLYKQGFRPSDTLGDLVETEGLIAPAIDNVDTGLSGSGNRPSGKALLEITNPMNAKLQPLTNPVSLVCDRESQKKGIQTSVNAMAVILIQNPKTEKLHVASAVYSNDTVAKTVFTRADYGIKQFQSYLSYWRTPITWSFGAEFVMPEVNNIGQGN